jgi:hypothetical protein
MHFPKSKDAVSYAYLHVVRVDVLLSLQYVSNKHILCEQLEVYAHITHCLWAFVELDKLWNLEL